MPAEVLNIIYSALGVIVTGLAGYVVVLFKTWISSKIKDKETAEMINKVTDIVYSAVQSVYQTFVEALKKEGKFTEEYQQQAKEKALAIINSELTPELTSYIQDKFGDIQTYLTTQIEAALYNLKNK